jgi:putative flippase GtrA
VNKKSLAIKYLCFAALAIFANLGVQRIVFSTGDSHAIYVIAVVAGTAAGLLVKYLLDKTWIFYDLTSGLKGHSRIFSRYAMTGLLTTSIFWGCETVFWLIWETGFMRELGALTGLIIGYSIKYSLDSKFVFGPVTEGQQT